MPGDIRPRRSVLYMPGSNARALEKGRGLAADALILDLEDAVAPDAKGLARDQVMAALAEGGYGARELVIRVNGPDSPWGADDLAAVAASGAHAVLLPKVDGAGAVAQAVAMLIEGRVERIVLSRPAVEAGENLGFLPGDLREKIDPYLRPLYDALHDMMPGEKMRRYLEAGDIEVAPLAFMRGRTLSNAYVILDEAQNTSVVQMKMCLTRLGENSRMAVTGDLSQIDLPKGVTSGLDDAVRRLAGVEGVTMVTFSDVDVVRHGLVTRIIRAYDKDSGAAS